MPMFFLDKRAQVICNELKKESVHQKVALSSWEMKKGNFVTPADALADPSPFTPFDGRTMHWYGPDEHYWFRADMTVPESFDGKTLVFHLRTQIEEWDDAKNPQFLLFVDGEVSQGMDMNHREVLITRSAKAGQTYHIELQSYTGTLHAEFSLIAEMWEVDPEINSLYWDLQVPLRAFSRLDEESRSRMDLTRVINDTVNLLDLREPYSEAYYASMKSSADMMKSLPAASDIHTLTWPGGGPSRRPVKKPAARLPPSSSSWTSIRITASCPVSPSCMSSSRNGIRNSLKRSASVSVKAAGSRKAACGWKLTPTSPAVRA